MSNTYLAEAHRDWHYVYGQYNTNCPLDCGRISPEQAEAEDLYNFIAYEDENGTARIRCGHCPARHATIEAVRACATIDRILS